MYANNIINHHKKLQKRDFKSTPESLHKFCCVGLSIRFSFQVIKAYISKKNSQKTRRKYIDQRILLHA